MAAALAAVCLSGDVFGATAPGAATEVVVTLKGAPLSGLGRSLQFASHRAHARELQAAQNELARRVLAAVPAARVRWRYRLVLDGFAVSLPRSEVAALARVPGVARVWPNVRYHALSGLGGPQQIGADRLWGPSFSTAGNGMKIGIIDDGLDATHPYFDQSGFEYPPGFPKGQVKYATSKVIVQRTFAPASPVWKYANVPFDPVNSFHATHVAGIAAGDYGVNANGTLVSGVAPNAWLGNYKALTIPTPDFGLDGNSAEIAAAIEAAVSDGMNVINLSIGEPEVNPARDLVVQALEGAVRAGVVPVVAAGNDFGEFGYGSVSSPGNTPDAITVAAVTSRNVIADFSSAGPTPVSLGQKPDVSGPGVAVLSSLPASEGMWGTLSGTSMATPHVAGGAALLKERHPDWTVAQIKSALVQTADPVHTAGGAEAPATREGGGIIDLPRADVPLLFAAPSGLSFGAVRPGGTAIRTVSLTDAGGGAGAGDWTVSTIVQAGGGTLTVPATASVPGTLSVTANGQGPAGDVTGFVVLTRGSDVRRIPYWFAVSAPKLASEHRILLARPGLYRGTTAGALAIVSQYRYPTGGDSVYAGPERAYRVRITGHPANFGVVVLSGRPFPHVTFDGSEDRLVGYPGLPVDLNPYRKSFGAQTRAAGAVLPAPGSYDIVFDTRVAKQAGPFTFRYWLNDTTPPLLRIRSTLGAISVAATDAGSGVDPSSIVASIDGSFVDAHWHSGTIRIAARPGRHHLFLSVADYEETRNMEDVPPILPNTATLRATVRVR